jgi:hypothetical protein
VSVYLRLNGERLLLDTAKCRLRYEEDDYDLTGATLDLYEMEWQIGDGTVGLEDPQPCKVLMLRDPFTGLTLELPVTFDNAERMAAGLTARQNGKRRVPWARR